MSDHRKSSLLQLFGNRFVSNHPIASILAWDLQLSTDRTSRCQFRLVYILHTLHNWNPWVLGRRASPKSVDVGGNYLGSSVRIPVWDLMLVPQVRGLWTYVVSINDYFRTFDRFVYIGDEIFDSLWHRFYLSIRFETPSYLLTPSGCVVEPMSHRCE